MVEAEQKEAHLLLYLWGNIESERGEKWNSAARSEHDLSWERIIPVFLVQCLAVNLRQV